MKKFVALLYEQEPPPDIVVLGGDISGRYVDYRKLKLRTEESCERWNERSLNEALAILGEYPGRMFAMLGDDDLESYSDIVDQSSEVEGLNCRAVYLEDEDQYLVGFPY